jgi:predicted dinucleotide-binding enzyme
MDVSNPETPDGQGLCLGLTTSGAEELARAARGARVVKAFSHYYAELLHEDVAFDGGLPSVLYCRDDADAKDRVRHLIASCGLDPVDAGDLTVARYLEPLAMLTVALVRQQGWGPTGVAWRLMRRRNDAA